MFHVKHPLCDCAPTFHVKRALWDCSMMFHVKHCIKKKSGISLEQEGTMTQEQIDNRQTTTDNTWNPTLYEDKHSFVWKYGAAVIELLAPQPGERILDLGCGTGQLTAQIADAG